MNDVALLVHIERGDKSDPDYTPDADYAWALDQLTHYLGNQADELSYDFDVSVEVTSKDDDFTVALLGDEAVEASNWLSRNLAEGVSEDLGVKIRVVERETLIHEEV